MTDRRSSKICPGCDKPLYAAAMLIQFQELEGCHGAFWICGGGTNSAMSLGPVEGAAFTERAQYRVVADLDRYFGAAFKKGGA